VSVFETNAFSNVLDVTGKAHGTSIAEFNRVDVYSQSHTDFEPEDWTLRIATRTNP